MRRAAVLALLLIGMQLIQPLGDRPQAQSLLTFGFLILAAYTVGEIASSFRLPKLVGYLVAGVLFGPELLGIASAGAIAELAPVSGVAIALIAFLAGAELEWKELRAGAGKIMRMLTVGIAVTFVAVAITVYALRQFIPFLQAAPQIEAVIFSLLFASLAVINSPVVTLAILSETRAKGPVARTTLGIVLVADVVVMLGFTGALAIARAMVPPAAAGAGEITLGIVAWEIGGALVIGAVLGLGVAFYLRFVERELFLFAVLIAFFGAEVARLAHVEPLLTLLVAGFVTENTFGPATALRSAMERVAAPIFVVFFALAGARIDLMGLAQLWPVVIPIVLVRLAAVWGGTTLGARWARASDMERRYVWMGLVSQAGVGIALAAVVAEAYPVRGGQIATIFLAVIAINQLMGPILFRHALVRSGEVVEATATEVPVDATRRRRATAEPSA
jgi:Kef-type K+ transport system membrane component KefB